MTDYKTLYHKLFNAVSDTINNLQKIQLEAEDEYVKMGEASETDSEGKILKFKER